VTDYLNATRAMPLIETEVKRKGDSSFKRPVWLRNHCTFWQALLSLDPRDDIKAYAGKFVKAWENIVLTDDDTKVFKWNKNLYYALAKKKFSWKELQAWASDVVTPLTDNLEALTLETKEAPHMHQCTACYRHYIHSHHFTREYHPHRKGDCPNSECAHFQGVEQAVKTRRARSKPLTLLFDKMEVGEGTGDIGEKVTTKVASGSTGTTQDLTADFGSALAVSAIDPPAVGINNSVAAPVVLTAAGGMTPDLLSLGGFINSAYVQAFKDTPLATISVGTGTAEGTLLWDFPLNPFSKDLGPYISLISQNHSRFNGSFVFTPVCASSSIMIGLVGLYWVPKGMELDFVDGTIPRTRENMAHLQHVTIDLSQSSTQSIEVRPTSRNSFYCERGYDDEVWGHIWMIAYTSVANAVGGTVSPPLWVNVRLGNDAHFAAPMFREITSSEVVVPPTPPEGSFYTDGNGVFEASIPATPGWITDVKGAMTNPDAVQYCSGVLYNKNYVPEDNNDYYAIELRDVSMDLDEYITYYKPESKLLFGNWEENGVLKAIRTVTKPIGRQALDDPYLSNVLHEYGFDSIRKGTRINLIEHIADTTGLTMVEPFELTYDNTVYEVGLAMNGTTSVIEYDLQSDPGEPSWSGRFAKIICRGVKLNTQVNALQKAGNPGRFQARIPSNLITRVTALPTASKAPAGYRLLRTYSSGRKLPMSSVLRGNTGVTVPIYDNLQEKAWAEDIVSYLEAIKKIDGAVVMSATAPNGLTNFEFLYNKHGCYVYDPTSMYRTIQSAFSTFSFRLKRTTSVPWPILLPLNFDDWINREVTNRSFMNKPVFKVEKMGGDRLEALAIGLAGAGALSGIGEGLGTYFSMKMQRQLADAYMENARVLSHMRGEQEKAKIGMAMAGRNPIGIATNTGGGSTRKPTPKLTPVKEEMGSLSLDNHKGKAGNGPHKSKPKKKAAPPTPSTSRLSETVEPIGNWAEEMEMEEMWVDHSFKPKETTSVV